MDTERGWAGRVLANGEINYRDDSDFYAIVWDGERVRRVDDGTTRAFAPPRYREADAPADVAALAAEWMVNVYWPPIIRAELDRRHGRRGNRGLQGTGSAGRGVPSEGGRPRGRVEG